MTSATDELRKLLDERGIEWKDGDAAYEIEWSTPDGRHCSAMYWKPTFTVLISGCTLEQAIAATLGGGECEVVQGKKGLECSKCGKELPEDPYSDYEGNFCPTCGARIRKAVER